MDGMRQPLDDIIAKDLRGVRAIKVADLIYGTGPSSMHSYSFAGGGTNLNGFAEGSLTEEEGDALAPGVVPGRVAFGRFSASEAAVGLVIGTLALFYLGHIVVVKAKK
jgi:hypothetical protein